jgi:hypothetical protein
LSRPWLPLILLLGAQAAFAQTAGSLKATVRVEKGKLALADLKPADATQPPQLSPGYMSVLRSDLDNRLRALGPLYCFGLPTFTREPGTCDHDDSRIETFTGTWEAFQVEFEKWRAGKPERAKNARQIFQPTEALLDLQIIHQFTGLTWTDDDMTNIDSNKGELVFTVAAPVRPWNFCGAGCEKAAEHDWIEFSDPAEEKHLATQRDLLSTLERFKGAPWRKPAIRAWLLALYGDRQVDLGNEPTVSIDVSDANEEVRHVVVHEGYRITDISLPATDTGKVAYSVLPDREFRALGKSASVVYPEGKRPFLSPDFLAQQGPLGALGYIMDLTPSAGPAGLMTVSIRNRPDPPPEGAEKKTEAPPATPDAADGKPHPKAPPAQKAAAPAAVPVWARYMRLEGGVSYRPAQSFRYVGGVSVFGGTLGTLAFHLGGAQAAGAFGTANYSKDFVAFGALRRKITLDVSGGSDFEYHRYLFGQNADERRLTASARASVELFRNRDGQWLRGFVEIGRSRVTVQGDDAPPLAPFQLATLDAGVSYYVENESLRFGRTFFLSPRVHKGVDLFGGKWPYSVGSVSATFTQAFPNRMEFRQYAGVSAASDRTPIVELPSFGGVETVRGFRTDEALGRRMWSLRNELWIPLPIRPGSEGVLEYVRQHFQVAGLVDAGGIYQTVSGVPGERAGVGAGVRVNVSRRLWLKVDYAYGLGETQQRPRNRFYFSVDTDPR